MEYLLLLYANENGWNALTPGAQQQQGAAAYKAYTEALQKSGALGGCNRLQPTITATTVRVANGKSQVLDGPYADIEGTARRLLPDRRAGSGCRDRLGGALPRGGPRHDRSAPGLEQSVRRARRCMSPGEGDVHGARARQTRSRVAATASSSPFSRRARAMCRGRRCVVRGVRVGADGLAENGCPANPEAWLLPVARRKVIDGARQRAVGDGSRRTQLTPHRRRARCRGERSAIPTSASR